MLRTLRVLIADPFAGRGLTERQRQVSALKAKGYTLERIAKELDLSKNTIKTHLQRSYQVLGTRKLIDELMAMIEGVLATGEIVPASDGPGTQEVTYHSAAMKTWRRQVLERDEYTCQLCGTCKKRMHAHHIKPIRLAPEKALDLANGLTVCPRCHRKLHFT